MPEYKRALKLNTKKGGFSNSLNIRLNKLLPDEKKALKPSLKPLMLSFIHTLIVTIKNLYITTHKIIENINDIRTLSLKPIFLEVLPSPTIVLLRF